MIEKRNDHYLDIILGQNRVPHAQGWTGFSMEELEAKAIKFAYSLFAQKGGEKHLDKLNAKTHPDFLIFEPSSKTGQYTIEQIRQITDKSQLYPHEAPAQFFVLHYAERMSLAAGNAFLKTLEEPIENTYFILLIEHLEELMSTLRSRVQILSFEQEISVQVSEKVQKLNAFLEKWPHFTYQDLYQISQNLQESLDSSSLNDSKEVIAHQQEVSALFIQIEIWYSRHRAQLPFNSQYFHKHFEKARLGSLRSMKFSLCLEYLFLSLKQKL